MEPVSGLITGIFFGIFLQKAEVLRYDRQVGALRLLDMTLLKFILSAVLVGSAGLYLLHDLGAVTLNLKPASVGAQVFGGLIFGIGWGLAGYCPGTAGGALGEGRLDGLWGMLGMLAGGGIHAVAYPWFRECLIGIGELGKATLPGVLGIDPWIVILVFAVACLLVFRFFERNGI